MGSDGYCYWGREPENDDDIWILKEYLEFPVAGRFYMIINSQYPGSRIVQDSRSSLPQAMTLDAEDKQLWRFEPDGDDFYVYNKHFKNARLYGTTSSSLLKSTEGRLHSHQRITIESLGNNRVKIRNKFGTLTMGSDKYCYWDRKPENDDDIWILKEYL